MTVERFTLDGDGLASLDGTPIAIEGVIPGEVVDVAIVEAGRGEPGVRASSTRARAVRLLEVVEPSPHRIVPRCRHVGECGGCTWQHIAYPQQLRFKRSLVAAVLREALSAAAPAVAPCLPSPGETVDDAGAPWGFRHKVHFVAGTVSAGRGLVFGHYRRRSRDVLPVVECPVHAEGGNRAAFATRDVLTALGVPGTDDRTLDGVARHVVVRVGAATNERLETLVVTADDERRLRRATARIAEHTDAPHGLHLNVHGRPGPYLFGAQTRRLYGRSRLREDIAGVSFLISPTAFFQTNVGVARLLVGVVAGAMGGARDVLDLFGGAGLFALPLAVRGHRVLCVEESAAAIDDGRASQAFSRIPRDACAFERARVEEFVARPQPSRAWRDFAPQGVVIDPPREGCAEGLLARILERWRPRAIAYVSCNPRALGRDLAGLQAQGWIGHAASPYRIAAVQPADMFPHTAHVETVAIIVGAGPADVRSPRTGNGPSAATSV